MSVFATLWNLLGIKTSFPGGFSDYNLDMICILPFKQGVILVGKLFDLLLCKFDLRWDDKVEDKPDCSLKSHAAVRKTPDRSTSKPDLLIFLTQAKSCSHLCSIQKRQFVNNSYRAYFSNFFLIEIFQTFTITWSSSHKARGLKLLEATIERNHFMDDLWFVWMEKSVNYVYAAVSKDPRQFRSAGLHGGWWAVLRFQSGNQIRQNCIHEWLLHIISAPVERE